MEFKEFKNETGKILKEYWITPAEWDALDKTTVQEGDIYHIVGTIGEEDLSASLMSKVENNAKLNSSNTFTQPQIFNKDITINGNIIQNGNTYKTHAEELYTKKNIIFTREGAISTLGDNEYTGIQAVKYDGTNDGQLVFDKDGTARVGDVGDTQPLATRSEKEELIGGNLLQWDAANNKIIDAGKSTNDLLTLKGPTYVLIEKVITGYSLLNAAPSDFATNYVSYYKTNGKARNDIDFAYVALTEAETFEAGKYYSKMTESAILDRHGESGKGPDGTPYAFKNMYFYFENLQTAWAAYTPINFYNGNSPFPYHIYLSRNHSANRSDVYANIYGNMMMALSTELTSEMQANSNISITRATIKDNMVLSGFKVGKLPADTTVLIYGAK